MDAKADNIKIAAIMSVAGPKVEEVYETTRTEKTKTYKDVKDLLDAYFDPCKDPVFSTVKFLQMAHSRNELLNSSCKDFEPPLLLETSATLKRLGHK